jgi:hypothetical protein
MTAADLEKNILRDEIERLTKELFAAKSMRPFQRKPLTDEEIHDCFQQRSRDKTKERRLITRAIERAHGIGGEYER